MVLCKRSTSRSSEQSMKHQSRSENMWKVCLFYSEDYKVLWLSNMADMFLEKFTKCTKDCGVFSWLCFRDVDWLGIQSPITWPPSSEQILSSNVTLETSAIIRFSARLIDPYQVQLIKPSVLHGLNTPWLVLKNQFLGQTQFSPSEKCKTHLWGLIANGLLA